MICILSSLYIVICHVQRFTLKSPSKKKTKFLKKDVSSELDVGAQTHVRISYNAFSMLSTIYVFHLLISHTKHPPSTPSHDCYAFMLWVGKYKYVESEHVYTESSSACEWERVYINMAKLNTKGGGVAW